jgi:hypothetical protein
MNKNCVMYYVDSTLCNNTTNSLYYMVTMPISYALDGLAFLIKLYICVGWSCISH